MDFFNLIDKDLKKQYISPKLLTHRICLLNYEDKKSAAFTDPAFIPFYYYLGKYIKPEVVLEIGFNLGLFSTALCCSCKSINNIIIFKEKPILKRCEPIIENGYKVCKNCNQFYETVTQVCPINKFLPRLGLTNLKYKYKNSIDLHVGSIFDKLFLDKLTKIDLVLINEDTCNYDKYMSYLEFIWQYLNNDALIICEFLSKNKNIALSVENFCKAKNRTPRYFKTRYKVGVIKK